MRKGIPYIRPTAIRQARLVTNVAIILRRGIRLMVALVVSASAVRRGVIMERVGSLV